MTEILGTVAMRRCLIGTALCVSVVGALGGCGALDVSDPTAIDESELHSAEGAELLRTGVLRAMSDAVDDGAYVGGLFADEFLYDLPTWETPETSGEQLLDRRDNEAYEALVVFGGGAYGNWQALRRAATTAIPNLRAYALPAAADAKVGEMLAIRAYATLRLAEDFCPGFPLHDIVNYKPVYGSPLSTEQVFTKALADFDSAVTYATDSIRILQLAQVGRGRTLLGLGRFEDAGSVVASIPTDYVANAEYLGSIFVWNDALAFIPTFFQAKSVANHEGGNGLDFVSANDPRVELTSLGTARDGVTPLYGSNKYPNQDAPVVIASGIEARLIEAEAAFHGGGDWLGILNALRTSCTDAVTCPTPAPPGTGGVAGLPLLTDPGNADGRVDLLFRERAFWLFGTGHRLADLRRLVRWYGRQAESVFPTGPYRTGGVYATGTSIPFPYQNEALYSPAVTGCTSR